MPVTIEWSPLISNDRKLLLAIGTSCGTISVWIIDEESKIPPKKVMETQGHSCDTITCLSISPDSNFLASGTLKLRGVVSIWSLNDGNLVYTVHGNGGVDVNGLTWINNNLLAITFTRSKTINILQYNLKHYIESSPLIVARKSLAKKGIQSLNTATFFRSLILALPSMLQEQHQMEKLNVQTGTQLMHSLYLKSLAFLALLLDLHTVICYPVKPFHVKDEEVVAEFQWLKTLDDGIKLAHSLIKRTDCPINVMELKPGDDEDDHINWSIKQDEQIMQWVFLSFKFLLTNINCLNFR